jgi:hypothetical protein
MSDKSTERRFVNASSSACTLGDACRAAQCDQHGSRCPDCPLRSLCENEDRWLV